MTNAVIRVGDGRGFIVQDAGRMRLGWRNADNIVITAAHCLPSLPRPLRDWEHTYKNLLSPLGQEPSVWAACFFFDPIGDIAVLGPPDDQELSDEYNAYTALVGADAVTDHRHAEGPPAYSRAWRGRHNYCPLMGGGFPVA